MDVVSGLAFFFFFSFFFFLGLGLGVWNTIYIEVRN